MARSLVDGVYEHLVTDELARLIASSSAQSIVSKVDAADAHELFAAHVAAEIRRVLSSLSGEDKVEHARLLTTRLLEHLASLTDADLSEQIRHQHPASPARRLLALHRGAVPERPSTPLATSTLLTRSPAEPTLGHELAREIATSDRIDAILAFVTVGGVRSLEQALHQFARRPNTELRLLTTTFTGTTELAALDMLARLPNARVKVSYDTQRTRLHAKAWYFHRNTGITTAYIGSANFTSDALGPGHEWVVKVCAGDLGHVIEQFAGTFNTLWEAAEFEPYSPDNELDRAKLQKALRAQKHSDHDSNFLVTLQPQPFQQQILDKLVVERELHQRRRNLIVAATGTGKTVVAALDYARLVAETGVPPRLLFLAHRKELLDQARRTFRFALQDASFGELLVGNEEPTRYEHVFASIQSVSSSGLIDRLGNDHFRHVVVDECHHVPAKSYQSVVPRLQPQYLVGLTATPERSDGRSLLPDFDGHIAAELRLWHALEEQLLVPFEYYGISDGIDLRKIRWARSGYDQAALAELYTGDNARADLIRHQLAKRVGDLRQIRSLGFCVSIEHAEFMAKRFTEQGIPSLAVHGSVDDAFRQDAPRRLQSREVNVLFTCDLYNEGVDLPFVDTLLLLRPTHSATLFLQQIGRGLRRAPKKASCLILDFIGQHRSEFRFADTLSALTGIPRIRLRSAIEDDLPYLPSGCVLQLDAVARDQILDSLRSSLGGPVRLTAELKDLASQGPVPTLAQFLTETARDVTDVYNAGGWTTLKHKAGLCDSTDDNDELSRKLGFLLHIDEPDRLRAYRDLITNHSSLTQQDRTRLHMLDIQLNHRGILHAAEETAQYLANSPTITEEFNELREVLENNVGIAHQIYPEPEWPLALHRQYTRREIAAAVGLVTAGQKAISLQGGILTCPGQRQLLFVTLDKSGKAFSPTTRYRDYAISPSLFHWETQSAASVSRPSGRRYTESATNGWTFHLFVRPTPDDKAYAYLGPAKYVSHEGDRPIAITWALENPMPAILCDRYATHLLG